GSRIGARSAAPSRKAELSGSGTGTAGRHAGGTPAIPPCRCVKSRAGDVLRQRDQDAQIVLAVPREMLDPDAGAVIMGARGEILDHVELAEPVEDRQVFDIDWRAPQPPH